MSSLRREVLGRTFTIKSDIIRLNLNQIDAGDDLFKRRSYERSDTEHVIDRTFSDLKNNGKIKVVMPIDEALNTLKAIYGVWENMRYQVLRFGFLRYKDDEKAIKDILSFIDSSYLELNSVDKISVLYFLVEVGIWDDASISIIRKTKEMKNDDSDVEYARLMANDIDRFRINKDFKILEKYYKEVITK
jgi:hypothetical protein